MRVAVTTNDLETVDVPFGRARHVVVYEVRRDRAHLQRVFAFDAPPARCDRRALRQRGAALEGCVVLFTLEIGEVGAAIARARDVHPVRVARPRSIADVLATLRRDLAIMRPWSRAAVLGMGVRGAR
jgi:nitrogen fixation protein NifX